MLRVAAHLLAKMIFSLHITWTRTGWLKLEFISFSIFYFILSFKFLLNALNSFISGTRSNGWKKELMNFLSKKNILSSHSNGSSRLFCCPQILFLDSWLGKMFRSKAKQALNTYFQKHILIFYLPLLIRSSRLFCSPQILRCDSRVGKMFVGEPSKH